MFSVTKKIAIAASMMAFCSGQFDALGSNSNNDDGLDHAAPALGTTAAKEVNQRTNSVTSTPLHYISLNIR
jgi:hypothetical protein